MRTEPPAVAVNPVTSAYPTGTAAVTPVSAATVRCAFAGSVPGASFTCQSTGTAATARPVIVARLDAKNVPSAANSVTASATPST